MKSQNIFRSFGAAVYMTGSIISPTASFGTVAAVSALGVATTMSTTTPAEAGRCSRRGLRSFVKKGKKSKVGVAYQTTQNGKTSCGYGRSNTKPSAAAGAARKSCIKYANKKGTTGAGCKKMFTIKL